MVTERRRMADRGPTMDDEPGDDGIAPGTEDGDDPAPDDVGLVDDELELELESEEEVDLELEEEE
jgi:hypothetical protein